MGQREHGKSSRLYFFYGKGNENNQFGTGFFVHHRILSAVMRVEFISDTTLYTALRGRWCHITVLSVHAPRDDSKDNFYEELDRVFHRFPKYHTKILLAEFNAKSGREDIFKPTIGNESLHQDSNDNRVGIVNLATSQNLVVKGTMLPDRNIHKYTWTSPDEKTHNQIHHILIDWRWHSSIFDVRFFGGADCDTDHYLVEKESE